MQHAIPRMVALLVGGLWIAPSALALERGTTIAFCSQDVHGNCWISKEEDEPYTWARFSCQVRSQDHGISLLASNSYQYDLDPMQAQLISVRDPKTGPVHNQHVYCRKITGAAPYSNVAFRRPNITIYLYDYQKCDLYLAGGGGEMQ